MRLISSSVTRIVIPCLLVNIRVCLHIGNQHLLHPIEDEVPLHLTNWVITWRDIQLGKDRVFKENFCLIHKPIIRPMMGMLPPWIFLYLSLTEILPIDPVLCDGQHL